MQSYDKESVLGYSVLKYHSITFSLFLTLSFALRTKFRYSFLLNQKKKNLLKDN